MNPSCEWYGEPSLTVFAYMWLSERQMQEPSIILSVDFLPEILFAMKLTNQQNSVYHINQPLMSLLLELLTGVGSFKRK